MTQPTRRRFLHTMPLAALPLAAAEPLRAAPELTFTDHAGAVHRLSRYRGQVMLLEFMLTTCPHCQQTAKLLSRLEREYGPRGFRAVSLAFNDDAFHALPAFVKNHQLTHLVGALPRDAVYSFAALSAVVRHSVPIIVFIDRAGVIRAQHEGDSPFLQNEEVNLRAKIAELLTGARGRPGTGRRVPAGSRTSSAVPQAPINRTQESV